MAGQSCGYFDNPKPSHAGGLSFSILVSIELVIELLNHFAAN